MDAVFEAAVQIGLKILSFLHIGTGRTEADAITPVANALVNPQRTGRLDQIVDERNQTTNIVGLQNLIAEIDNLRQAYEEFLNDSRFTDGRASQQAKEDMFPLMDSIKQSIMDKIISLGGQISGPLLTQGYGTTLPTLRYSIQNFPFIPQAGTIPPNSPLSPIRSYPTEVVSAGFGGDPLTLLVVAGLAFMFINRR
jgi:hypothetical protein